MGSWSQHRIERSGAANSDWSPEWFHHPAFWINQSYLVGEKAPAMWVSHPASVLFPEWLRPATTTA